MQGKVKFFNVKKGYGFITPNDGRTDVFFHHSAILGNGYKTMDSGDDVTFETELGLKGTQAKNVSKM